MTVRGSRFAVRGGAGHRAPRTAHHAPLLFVVLSACATVQPPPGGPLDTAPPAIVAVTPDSGATVPGLKDPVIFRFDEVVNERPGMTLDQMVVLSPRPRQTVVSWRRTSIEVKPSGGWQPNVAYRVSLLPGMMDLRNNKQPAGRTIVFSTGGPIPATTLTGRVVDWEAGQVVPTTLVEAIRISDSLVYWDVTDSTGSFRLAAVPPGQYAFLATIDRNSNRRRDTREPFDSVTVTLDSTVARNFWTFTHDTVGPRIRTVTRSDSITVRVEFNQMLAQGAPDSTSVTVRQLPDSTPVAVATVLTQARYDSLIAAARPAGDTLRGAAADPGRQPGVSANPRPGTPLPVQPPVPRPGAAPLPGRSGALPVATPPDSATIRLLAERARLAGTLVVRLAQPLVAGGRYVFSATVANPSGVRETSASTLVIPAAAPPDSARRVR